jgi:AraC-like DNA-binding protein
VDVLSEVLANCKSERAATARFVLGSPYALHSTGVEGTLIRMSAGGSYWIQLDGAPALKVGPKDLVMLPHGSAHTVSSLPGLPAQPFADLIARHAIGAHGDNPLVFRAGGPSGSIDLFSAHLWFSAYCRNTVIKILPPLIHVRADERPETHTLATMMEALVDETLAQRPGWKLSARRMADLLLVHILRDYLANEAALEAGGWLRGLTDPHIAHAIMLIHQDPRNGWTVDTLARSVGMSRTRFSARFRERVGESPISYLTSQRMTLAAEMLETDDVRLAKVAEQVGYGSDKVFARAFVRWAGVSPGAYASRARTLRSMVADAGGGPAAAPS